MVIKPTISQGRRTPDHNYRTGFDNFKDLRKNPTRLGEVFDDLKQSYQIKLSRYHLTDVPDVTKISINSTRPCRHDIFIGKIHSSSFMTQQRCFFEKLAVSTTNLKDTQ